MKKALVWICLIAMPAIAAGPKKSAAVVGGDPVTVEELDRTAETRLFRIRTEEYNIRRQALEELIVDRLLRQEAARRGVTVEELLKAEVDTKITMPTAEEIEPFYESTRERYGAMSKDEAIEQIRAGMHRTKSAQRMTEFVKQLRAAASVQVKLDAPRIRVAADGPSRGNASAPVTIVEFSDFECTFCGRASETIKKIEQNYGDKIRVVYRDFPLPSHSGAGRAAEAAHCAGEQGKFWEMHDRLFSKPAPITDSDIRRYASELPLVRETFDECLGSGRHAKTWRSSHAAGKEIGVQSTPTFFVNGRMIAGAAPYEAFARVIEEELERGKAGR